eukprot:m51a1_g13770 putative calcium calmodulin-dependent protein kinase type iv-like (535) ;mRNA; r:262247-264483
MAEQDDSAVALASDEAIHEHYSFDPGRDELGRGNCGVVYRARRARDAKLCALKATAKHRVDPKEIRCWAMLRHPNVVQLYETFEGAKDYYFAMEYVAGGSLEDVVHESYCEQDARSIARQLAEAVRYMHSMGVVHRDIKLENLLVSCKEADKALVKVADFGVATLSWDKDDLSMRLGTPGWMAPEVERCERASAPYGKPCDLWSLGMVIYALLSGETPFVGWPESADDEEWARKIESTDPNFSGESWKEISPSAVDLVRRLLVVDPRHRLTAEQVLQHPWFYSDVPRAAIRAAGLRSRLANLAKRRTTICESGQGSKGIKHPASTAAPASSPSSPLPSPQHSPKFSALPSRGSALTTSMYLNREHPAQLLPADLSPLARTDSSLRLNVGLQSKLETYKARKESKTPEAPKQAEAEREKKGRFKLLLSGGFEKFARRKSTSASSPALREASDSSLKYCQSPPQAKPLAAAPAAAQARDRPGASADPPPSKSPRSLSRSSDSLLSYEFNGFTMAEVLSSSAMVSRAIHQISEKKRK